MASPSRRLERRTHRVSAAILALLTGLLTACTSTPSKPPGAGEVAAVEGPREQIQSMLRERGRRLAAGDVEGYMAGLAPHVRPDERAIAEGAVAVPLAEVNLVMDEADVNAEGNRVTGARIDFVHRYEGLPPDNVFRFRLNYELDRRDGAWVVTKSVPDETYGPIPMWARGKVAVARSPHFLVLHRPGMPRLEEALRVAEEARAALLRSLSLEADATHLLQLARDHPEYEDVFGASIPEGAPAVTTYVFSQTRGHGARPDARQMTVNLQPVLDTPGARLPFLPPVSPGDPDQGVSQQPPPPEDRRVDPDVSAAQVFQHELGHLALTRVTRPSTPGWVKEGGAMLLSGEQRLSVWKLLVEEPSLLRGLNLANLAGQGNLTDGLQYGYVNAVVAYLVETYGVPTFWNFYRDFTEYQEGDEAHPLEQRLADATHRLLRRIYDLDEQRLDDLTAVWMRKAVGVQ